MQYCYKCEAHFPCDCAYDIDEDYNSFMSDMDYDTTKANQVLDNIINPENQSLIETTRRSLNGS